MNKNYKLMILTFVGFGFIGAFFQNCSVSKLSSAQSPQSSLLDATNYLPPTSLAGSQIVSNDQVNLKEYRHIPTGRFFYTSRVNDQSVLESAAYAAAFQFTGKVISVKATAGSGFSSLARLYSSEGFHFYTVDENQKRDLLNQSAWKDEGSEGFAVLVNPNSNCPSSPVQTYPVSRLYHAASFKYRFVFEAMLKGQLLAQGYVDQGVAFCATGLQANAPIQNPTAQSCTFNGASIAHGSSITAFLASSVSAGSSCSSQLRTCNNGSLSGSYTQNTCVVATVNPPPGSCTSSGSVDANQAITCSGQNFSSLTHYLSVNPTNSCVNVNGTNVKEGFGPCLQCTQSGVSSGASVCASCSLNGISVNHGNSITAYSSSTVASGLACSSVAQQRTCNNGTLSGSFQNTNCSVSAPVGASSCAFGSTTIANGGTVTAYQSATSSNCASISQVRTCSNGVLSGSYTVASCSAVVTTPKGCTDQVSTSNYILNGNTDFNTPSVDARMTGSEVYVIEINPGPYMATAGKSGLNLISWNVRSGAATREVSVSTCRGDFTSSSAQKLYLPEHNVGDGGGFTFTLDEPNRTVGVSVRTARLNSGQRYFINFRNTSCLGSSYGADTCMMYWFAVPANN